MRDSKLIIVTGMSGTGKSTTSKKLAKQYQHNGMEHFWLHEEVSHHPIREDEFSIGNIYSEEDMDRNVAAMFEKWKRLVERIEESDCIYIMEGCLYQNIIRYFFSCNYPIEKITYFYDTLMEILNPLKPTIVFLYRPDVKKSFEEAFYVRGDRWKNLILEPEQEGYFSKHNYVGEESIYAMWEDYQSIANTMFERYKGFKIRLNTSFGLWDQTLNDLTEYMGLEYKTEEEIPNLKLEQYCGKYQLEQFVIEIKLINNELYCQTWFWSNMKLIPLGHHEFDFLSFPIKLQFQLDNKQRSVKILGTYDWSINNKTLYEIK